MPPQYEPDLSSDLHGIAVYLASMSGSMAKMAHQNRFDALAYLLELAQLEAETLRLQLEPRPVTGTSD